MRNIHFVRYVFFAILILCSLGAYPQHIPERFENVTGELGEPGLLYTQIVQDSNGYLWFYSLFNGLYKYNGYSTTKYKYAPFNSGTISQNMLYTLKIDKKDTFWLGTPEGLCKFDPHTEKFTRFDTTHSSGMPDLGNVSAINEDNEGMLWVGNYDGRIWRYDRGKKLFTSMTSKLGFQKSSARATDFHEAIYSMYKDKLGNLWIGTSAGMYEVIIKPGKSREGNAVSFIHYQHNDKDSNSLSGNAVLYIFEDHAGILWVATKFNGLNSFDPATKRFTHYLSNPSDPTSISTNDMVWSGGLFGAGTILEDRQDNLWIATANGLNKLNKERTKFTAWFENQKGNYSLKSNQIYSLGLDKEGNLFISTRKGLQTLNLNQKPFGLLQKDTTKNSISNNEITGIAEDTMSNIWISSLGGVDKWDKRSGNILHYQHNPNDPNSLKSNTVNSLMIAPGGDVYICNQEYLCILKKGTGNFEHYNTNSRNLKDIDAINLYCICRDRDGIIWLGSGNGIKSFDPVSKKFTHYYYEAGNPYSISDYSVQCILADSHNNIWVGTGSIAFNRFDKRTGRFTHYRNNAYDPASISSNMVNTVFEDSKGNLWIGTFGGGLCRYNYNKDNFTTVTRDKNLPWSDVYSIQEDNAGNLWLGTEKGLSCYNIATHSFINYDVSDGLQDIYFAAGIQWRGSSCKGRDGTLYFGGDKGLNYFDPAQIHPNSYIPPVVITQFKIFDKLQPGLNDTGKIVLNYDQNFFSFEFAALNYTSPSKNRYAYRLEGVDNSWIFCNDRRYAAYTNLGPGEYTFRVKASNNDGIWNEEGIAVKVIINPPWWRTWWAYTLYALLVVAGIFAVDRIQRRRVIAKEREQSRQKELQQAREIEKAYEQLKSTQAQLIQSEKMAGLGKLTAGIAHEIQNPLNFVNNFSEVSKDLVTEMEEAILKDDKEEAIAISADIKDNLQKISFHGKRADSIVKGMLQHSRVSTGKIELIDINALVDECARLCYEEWKVKDKQFNARFETDYDRTIGNISVVQQDISRVFLNLFNNALYAGHEKKRQLNGTYEPQVQVSTKKANGKLEISINDNGNGIPQKIIDKIFQPFFTTKPSGQGTGLGLSLSYDIIKAHGGDIRVVSKDGEGSEFIISLPLNTL